MVTTRDDEWENPDIVCVKVCERTPSEAEVQVRPLVRAKIEALMKKYQNREWLGYLIGRIDGTPFLIDDMVIPEQVATSASVDDIVIQEGLVPEGFKMLGVIHSHHNMGIGFSGTDDNWINQNHDISILVSHKEITGQVRFNTPCGAKKIVKCKVTVKHDLNFDADNWIEEASKSIKDRAPVQTNFQNGWEGYDGSSYGWGGRQGNGWARGGNGNGKRFATETTEQAGTMSRDAVNRKTEDLFAGIDKEFTLEQELMVAFDLKTDEDVFDTNCHGILPPRTKKELDEMAKLMDHTSDDSPQVVD